jgi:acyl carrier protein
LRDGLAVAIVAGSSSVLSQINGNLPMQAFDTELRNRIIKLVKGILEQNSLTADVAPQTKLVDAGLTSMDMVNLMLGVEAEFDFTIPQTEITPENFQSVETLERMVATQLQLATAA